MKRLALIVRVAAVCGGTLGLVLSNYATNWLSSYKLPFSPPALALVALAIVVISAEALKETSELLFSNMRPLRRLVLGRQYVEGSWIDVAYAGGKPVSIGIIRIEPDGTGVRISGELFNLNGSPRGTFRSEIAEISWPTIRYKYSAVRGDAIPGTKADA